MRFGSVCSGIESASLAWEPLGWRAAWFSEIEKFPSAVLTHHWPHVPNYGDMCDLPELIRKGLVEAPSILVGGTPCQAFSVAGMRRGMEDPRGQLTIKYVEIANAIDEQRPGDECITVWENVPGVLSSRDNAFGCFLGALVGDDDPLEPGPRPVAGKSNRIFRWNKKHGDHVAKWPNAGCVFGPQRAAAWRVLDAQYFGVAQRRRRVFVVSSARERFSPAAVLFESEGVRRDSPPSRETGPSVASYAVGGLGTCGADDNQGQAGHLIPTHPVAPCLQERGGKGPDSDCTSALAITATGELAHSLTAERFDASEDGTGRGTPVVAFQPRIARNGRGGPQDIAFPLTAEAGKTGKGDSAQCIATELSVRRLMPVECERLQGMPDGHTAIPGAKDGPRYKAIGNSKAVPVVRWLGRRLEQAL